MRAISQSCQRFCALWCKRRTVAIPRSRADAWCLPRHGLLAGAARARQAEAADVLWIIVNPCQQGASA